jgi:hypothetical protein
VVFQNECRRIALFEGCGWRRRVPARVDRPLASIFLIASLVLLVPFVSSALAGHLDLEWEAPSTNVDGTQLTDLAKYRVYYGTGSGVCAGASYQEVASAIPNPVPGTLVSYSLSGLTTGTTYFVQVSAIDGSGNESACSNEVSGPAASDGADTTAPAGSITLNEGAAYTAWTAATLNLSATDAVGVTGYYVSISATTPAAGAAGWVAVTPATSYTGNADFTLSPGDGTKTVYAWYKDAAGNVSAGSSDSIVLDQTAPSNGTLTATAGSGQVALSWSGASDGGSGLATANTYKLVFATGAAPSAQCASGIQIYQGTGTSYTHTGRTNGTTYYYRVCAVDQAGNISAGATASATPQASVTVTVAKNGKGSGMVSSSPTGVTCGLDCSESYAYNTIVTLTAAPDPGSVFKGWSGDCTGAGTCTVTATQARNVTATFSRAYLFTDDPLLQETTPVKTIHLTELRTAVNTARADYGLGASTWTDPTLVPRQTEAKRVHLTELRTALSQVYAAAGLGTPSFTDPTVTPWETPIKAAHLSELRSYLRALP